MFSTYRNPTSAYQQVSVEANVAGSDPYYLILMLFEAADTAIATAKVQMQDKRINEKSAALSKAIDIILNGLKASLDVKAGGEIAENLAALYDYMVSRLLAASLRNDTAPLDEVKELLGEIHMAWKGIPAEARKGDAVAVSP